MDLSEGVVATRRRVEHAARDLVCISEIDAPFGWIHFAGSGPDDLTVDGVARLTGTELEPVAGELEDFLGDHVNGTGPLAALPQAERARYRRLCDTLRRELPGVQVYLGVGGPRRCFLLGRLPDGSLGGLETRLLERRPS